MLKDSTIELTGNDRYEGYAVDLIEALVPILGVNYEIIIQADENVGIYDNQTQTWDGMIGKIISGIADLAIGISVSVHCTRTVQSTRITISILI